MLKSKKQLVVAFGVLLFTVCLFRPMFAHAAGLVPCGGPSDNHPCGVVDAFYGLARVTNWLILMAGVYAVYQFCNAGIWLVLSMGNEERITKYRSQLNNAIIGFFLVVAAFMIVNTAVNGLLRSKCYISFSDPLTYVTIKDPSTCLQPTNPSFNPVNKDIAPTTTPSAK